jgi:hypothetical protein
LNLFNYQNGLEGLIINPMISIMFSLVLIFGVIKIGKIILLKLDSFVVNPTKKVFFSPIIGLAFILLILNPLIYLTKYGSLTLQFLSLTLFCFGLLFIFNFKFIYYVKNIIFTFKSSSFTDKISFLLLSFYFFISLAPITNADSLDYHIGVPLDILKNSRLIFHPEWFASNTSGIGDFMNGIGLALGAEQFPGLIQFLCIFSIFGIIRYPINSYYTNLKILDQLGLIFLSTPVLLFLGSSSKPQLLALLFISASISIFYHLKNNKEMNSYWSVLLIYIFLVLSSLIKYNFFLSSALIFLLTFPIILKYKYNIKSFLIFLIPLLLMIPYFNWKINNYQLGFFESIYNMLPINLPGYTNYQTYLKNYRDNSLFFPLSLFIPFSFGTISTCIGLGSVLFLSIFKLKYKPIILLIFSHITLTYLYGQINARFLFESLIIILISISYFQHNFNFFNKKFFKLSLYFQTLLIFVSLLFFSYNLVFLSFVNNGRIQVMNKSANGYSLYNWLNNQIFINKNDNIIVAHRSQSLSKFSSISIEWNNYTKSYNEKKFYINLILKKNPSYIVLLDDTSAFPILTGYNRRLMSKFNGNEATRNPFNLGHKYTAYLFKLSKYN